MTIAWLLDTYPSPTETFIARDIQALRARGLTVQVWALHAGEGAHTIPQLSAKNALAATLRDSTSGAWRERPHFWQATGTQWARVCRDSLRDVQWVHAGWANYPAWLACGAARELGMPWSFSAHARDLWVDGGDLTAKLGAARFALCCTREGIARLRKFTPNAAKALYAPHGLPIADFPFIAWQPPAPQGTHPILSVGRLVPKKGFDVLIEAVALLRAGGLDATASIVGEGPDHAPLEALIARLGLGDYVRLEGALPASRVQHLMSQAIAQGALFALPCRVLPDGDRDGLPNVLLEAAACGLPLITTLAGSVTDLVDEMTGVLCPPDNPRALQASLRNAWHDPAVTQERCRVARQSVLAGHDSARTGEVLAQTFLKARAAE